MLIKSVMLAVLISFSINIIPAQAAPVVAQGQQDVGWLCKKLCSSDNDPLACRKKCPDWMRSAPSGIVSCLNKECDNNRTDSCADKAVAKCGNPLIGLKKQ